MLFSRTLSRKNPLSRTLLCRTPLLRPFDLFENQEGGGGGGATTPPPARQSRAEVQAEVQEALQGLLSRRNNDPMDALAVSIRENHALRLRAEAAERDRDAAQANILDDKTKAKLAAYEALGKPEEVKAQIEAGTAAIGERDQLKREGSLTEVAGLLGLKPNALYKQLMQGAEVTISGEGEARKASFKVGDKQVDFEEYIKGRPELADALPALQAGAGSQAVAQATAVKPVVPFLKSAPAGGGGQVSLAERIRQEEAAKKGGQAAAGAGQGAGTQAPGLESRLGMATR